MSALLLSESEVNELVRMPDALEAVRLSLQEQGRGTGINEPRRRVHQPHGVLHIMAGALVERGYWGFKAYTSTRQGTRFLVNLYDVETGRLLAILEAGRLGQLRTGAASGVATDYLARKRAAILAVIGSGYQAESQLEAIAQVRVLEDVRVYSRTASRREAFARDAAQTSGLPVRAVASVEEAVQGADILAIITNASKPVVTGGLLEPGMHINAAGSNGVLRAELDAQAVSRADRIFTDDPAQARFESGDLIQAYERNQLDWAGVRPLADLVAGVTAGRQSADEITLFESHGIALWDVALAAVAYERARAQGKGQEINFESA